MFTCIIHIMKRNKFIHLHMSSHKRNSTLTYGWGYSSHPRSSVMKPHLFWQVSSVPHPIWSHIPTSNVVPVIPCELHQLKNILSTFFSRKDYGVADGTELGVGLGIIFGPVDNELLGVLHFF